MMTDHVEEIRTFTNKIMNLCRYFFEEYDIEPNTLFMSNNTYWKLLRFEREFSLHIKFDFSEKKVFGLNIKILGSEEGKDEMYVGIIEE